MDTGICPYCKKVFEVEQYGKGFKCPYCKGKVDLFPDFSLSFEAGSWNFEVGFPPDALPILAKALAWSALKKIF